MTRTRTGPGGIGNDDTLPPGGFRKHTPEVPSPTMRTNGNGNWHGLDYEREIERLHLEIFGAGSEPGLRGMVAGLSTSVRGLGEAHEQMGEQLDKLPKRFEDLEGSVNAVEMSMSSLSDTVATAIRDTRSPAGRRRIETIVAVSLSVLALEMLWICMRPYF